PLPGAARLEKAPRSPSMHQLSRPAKWCVAIAALVFVGPIPTAVVADSVILSDNLSAASAGTETATGDTWLTASFGTDGSAYTLESVTLLMARTSVGEQAELDLHTDGGLQPGSLVGTLTTPASIPTTLSDVTFTASGLDLAANSTYWVVLKATSGSFDWSWT